MAPSLPTGLANHELESRQRLQMPLQDDAAWLGHF